MRARLRPLALTAVGLALAAAGCGSGSPRHTGAAHHTATRAQHSPQMPALTLPAPAPTGVAASPTAVRVIKAWSTALRDGHIAVAAAYFALPSAFVDGVASGTGVVSAVTIKSVAEARAVNESLPCGATFLSADQRGRYVNALFRLGERRGPGGGNCGIGTGQTARTNFLIGGGKILEWIRAPDDPGDNSGAGGGTGTAPSQPTPNPPSGSGIPVA